ncbi:hypothetical protein [Abyssisolibacter fermentans]|uniref:hypothetical protein n=1 Tax=Abyssisolibacter fermentans TaxID=1766203 RepID=UPI00083726AD|nr:hypothetical protein [Abyssisolibacter fermentans]
MAKSVIKLKQHTPMIHFQYYQEGVTLRATELKPKLDKFLIKYAFKDCFDNYKYYLKGFNNKKCSIDDFKDHRALDYKVNIVNEGETSKDKPFKSLYFGNMGDKNENIQSINVNGDINVEFISFNKKLLDIINANIGSFFAVSNFGRRQNKGFGSFYIKNRKDCFKDVSDIYDVFWYINYNKTTSINDKLSNINIIYSLMKGGINFPKNKYNPKCYEKSFLFKYMLNKNVGNEKRFIKENFDLKTNKIVLDGMKKKYVRAMLGVAEKIDFRGNKEEPRDGTIEINSKIIERFKSPITFKIIDNYLFILPEDFAEEIYDKKFEFIEKDTKKEKENRNKKNIYTPSKNEFILNEFIAEFVSHFNQLKEKGHSHFDRTVKHTILKYEKDKEGVIND